ncbi:MAG: TerB family tellurite resistance protein [Rhizobiales bacterium]|nr:TerB family tellurite resistance protein [Hyphomicrobiales bacterium]
MWHKIKSFADKLMGQKLSGADLEDDDFKLSAVALMVHAARIDGFYSVEEALIMRTQIKKYFGITDVEAAELVKDADKAEHEAIDLYKFTKSLNDQLDNDGRKEIVKLLWAIVLADNEITPFEDNLIWRVSELLGVSTKDRIALKEQVKNYNGKL